MVTEARYEKYQEFNGVQFPTDIDIWRPKEEYSIGISVVKLTLNEALKDEQFALAQPPGSQLQRLDANGNSNTAQKGSQ